MVSLSVNMIFRNEEPVVKKVLDNIFQQIDGEFVLIDNMSRDRTFDILKSYERDNVIVDRYNGPKGGARNKALILSHGKYILCLDGDQIYYNLQKLIDEYLNNYDGYGLKVGRSSFPILAPRELLIKVGGWRNLVHIEDWDLWFRLTDSCKYLYLANKDYIFGDHLHDHKMHHTKWQTAKGLIERYRDRTLTGLPSPYLKDNPELLPFYVIGKLLVIPKYKMLAHYKCTKHLREKLPPKLEGIDWDLKRHYNLLKYEKTHCNDLIFDEAIKIFEEKYSR
ncbi:glycosyltransferase [Acidianus brierleyi]|uniref:Glycosyltransferase family 2 protein n=1 Tax=Acidianus brierleyi TaxID=41673 RepID=A0A2U9ID67_9CREN|nr:glycosyltransferase family A protein [Acidianus brierleyi]AWR93973.1 glycosyltransferase [Acidianus brierleyi]